MENTRQNNGICRNLEKKILEETGKGRGRNRPKTEYLSKKLWKYLP